MIDGSIFIYILTAFASIFIVGQIGDTFLNSALRRGVAGSLVHIGTSTYLISYTNFLSFIDASLKGQIGFPGYLFIISLAILVLIYATNLFKYKVAIR